jgi:hypothetical protein
MSLMGTLIELLKERGDKGATSEELHREVLGPAGFTRQQVCKAMENARTYGYATSATRGRPVRYYWQERKQTGKRKSRAKAMTRPVSSPWNMNEGILMRWPPQFEGGRVYMHLQDDDELQAA